MEDQSAGETINPNDNNNDRLDRLAPTAKNRSIVNIAHTKWVRRMRLMLPLIALFIIGVLLGWSELSDEQTIPVQEQQTSTQSIGKNELVNPRFESTDEKKQPYTITALRAVQGENNENLIMLEKPVADILLNSGNWLAIQADQGAFREDTQRLLLKDNVKIFHDLGYQMTTPQLHVDMNKEYAWSQKDIYAQGPAGTLQAKGMELYSTTGRLVFTGPAKLTLNKALKGLN